MSLGLPDSEGENNVGGLSRFGRGNVRQVPLESEF